MLSFFRSGGIGQVLVAGVAFAIIVVFALEFRTGSNASTAKLTRECAVSYAGNCLDAKDYYAAHGMIVDRRIEPKMARQLTLNKRVLDGLVERELLAVEAEKLGLEVSEEAQDQDLMAGRVRASLPADTPPELIWRLGLCQPSSAGYGCAPGSEYPVRQLQVKRTEGEPFDYKLYEKQIRLMTNRGPKEFKEMQKRELLAARMRDIVRSRVRIPEPEAYQLFERDRSKVVVRSVTLKRDWFAKFAVELDDVAVTKWSLANQQQVDGDWTSRKADWAAGCALISEIFVELPANPSDEEKQPVRLKAEQARERIAKGEDFAQVAREVSQGQTASLGGELGCVGASYGIGADDLKKAAEALKPAELSTVVESPRGYHVLKVSARLAEADVESAGRKYVARRLYTRFAAAEVSSKFAEKLIERAKGGEKLEEATRALCVDFSSRGAAKAKDSADTPALLAADRPRFEVSAPFNASGNPLPDVDPTEPLAAKAFELKKPDEVYGTPLPTGSGAVVLQLKERTDASRDEFVKEKANVVRALVDAKAGEALVRYVADLRRAAGDKLQVMSQFGEEAKARAEDE
ncbi:MAG TPA: peptidylprolyl isomerase [Polyangiaceae bacterium]|nr:peptidylprolyl isomerase [Polyangiaceae bacterium]